MAIKTSIISLATLVVVAVSIIAVLPRQKDSNEESSDIDVSIINIMEEASIPGLAISVIRNGDPKMVRGYGLANIEKNQPVTIDTPFNIASISKPILGVALLQLAERGLLNIDNNINAYLPFIVDNPNVENEVISIRSLATHTSGLADFYDVSTYTKNIDPSIPLGVHLKSMLTRSGDNYSDGKYYLPHTPGTQREYSNLGAGLAGFVLESVYKQGLAEYSQLHIFKPLNMTNTGWLLSEFDLSTVATPYEVKQCIPYISLCADWTSPKLNFLISKIFNPPSEFKSLQAHPHYGNPQYPDGGVRSSINDLTKFVMGILGSTDGQNVFTTKLKSEMLKTQLPNVDKRQRFFWRDDNFGKIGHKGSDIGVFTYLYFDPKNNDAVIILMNRGADLDSEIAMNKLSKKLWAL